MNTDKQLNVKNDPFNTVVKTIITISKISIIGNCQAELIEKKTWRGFKHEKSLYVIIANIRFVDIKLKILSIGSLVIITCN